MPLFSQIDIIMVSLAGTFRQACITPLCGPHTQIQFFQHSFPQAKQYVVFGVITPFTLDSYGCETETHMKSIVKHLTPANPCPRRHPFGLQEPFSIRFCELLLSASSYFFIHFFTFFVSLFYIPFFLLPNTKEALKTQLLSR
jgi:hypothetical protein